MKKLFLTLSAAVIISAALTSCGEKYIALSDEQITAKATEKFEKEGKAAVEAAKAECAAGMWMAVDAKFSEMVNPIGSTPAK